MTKILLLVAAVAIYVGVQFTPQESAQAGTVPTTTIPAPTYPSYCVRTDVCDSLFKAGFTVEQAHVMYSIGVAESGLRIDVKGDVGLMNRTWSYSEGCFQLRLLQHPGDRWWRDAAFVEASLDNQAKAAYVISVNGTDFRPWTTFKTGKYKQFL